MLACEVIDWMKPVVTVQETEEMLILQLFQFQNATEPLLPFYTRDMKPNTSHMLLLTMVFRSESSAIRKHNP